MTQRRLAIGALALLGACLDPDPPTQTILSIDATPAARAVLARIKLQAIGPSDDREPAVETEDPKWPIKLVFAPKNADPSRRFELAIDARDADGTHLASLRLRTGFLRNQTRYASLLIHEGCTTHPAAGCGEDDACNAWSVEVDAGELGSSAARPRTIEATCEGGGAEEDPPRMDDPAASGGSTAPAPQAGAAAPVAGGAAPSGGSGGAGAAAPPPTRPVEGPTGTCPAGYVREGDVCVDIDECANTAPCGEHGRCQNRGGDYTCECDEGFIDQGSGCEDVDECAADNGGCTGLCENAIGSAVCSCEGDAWLLGDRKGCGSFGSATRVSLMGSAQPMQPRFAFDAAGDGLAAWTQSDGTRSFLWTRRYVAGEGWAGFPARFPIGDTGSASNPRVALDDGGRGVLVWMQTSAESRTDLWAARYDGASFGPAAKIEADDAGSVYDPSVALAPSGDGFAVWTQSDGTRARIRANRFDAASGWSEARAIQTSETDQALTPRVAVDAAGNATIGWTQAFISDAEAPRISAWLTRFDAALGRWRLPSLLDDGALAGVPDTALFEPSGHALTIWTRATTTQVSVWARSQSSDSSRNEPVQIGPESSLVAVVPRVALSREGRGAAVWPQGQATAVEVWANRYDGEGDRWGEAEKLSENSSTAAVSPQIAVDAAGDGFVVWSEVTGTSRVVRAARLQADGGFIGQIVLASDQTAESPASSPPALAVNAAGTAVALWDVLNDGQYQLWSRTFE